jgi:enterochelin esterase-like enzyme
MFTLNSRPGMTAAAQTVVLGVLLLASSASAEPHTFVLNAPDARQVYLAGEMTDWDRGKLPMRKGADGNWRLTVDLGRGEWIYKFVADGKWIADPASLDRDADGQGGEHSLMFVGDGDWRERAAVPKGRVDTVSLDSAAWGKALKLNVYLPPGFERGRNYPVLWLLHGAGMDADQWLKTGKVNRYMDNLIARGAIRPFVIVMPSSERVPYTGKSERFIAQELPAWLASTYGLRTMRATSAIAGMSMGGTGAFELPLRHPDRYGFSVALSGYYDAGTISSVRGLKALPMPATLLCGTEDHLLASNRQLVRALREQQLDFNYREDPGGHTWQYWSSRMVEMLTAVDKYFATGRERI